MEIEQPQSRAYELIHYTKSCVTGIDLNQKYRQTTENLFYHTPNGLWVSVAGKNDWERYCRTQNQNLEKLETELQIMLKPSAKILNLYSAEVFDAFEQEYCYYPAGIARQGDNYTLNLSVAWEELIAAYQGMIMPIVLPKLYNMGLWYDTWCCTCGCIWDLQAVEKAVILK
ncbi:MAG: hypothetical protein LBG91_00295 [Treponema sp.]|jgi:hypothetical protein|nr:hypothetical protein [Treponema sp.]